MTDNSKKRTSSFRKIFPSLFFSHRLKGKNANKDLESRHKNIVDRNSNSNQYQNPRFIVDQNRVDQVTEDNNERIYENLSKPHHSQNKNNEVRIIEVSSNHSSSSTLVSEKAGKNNDESDQNTNEKVNAGYMARPQVPPKPQSKVINSPQFTHHEFNDFENQRYPDVYYHSLEKLTDKISPLDEIEIYKASKARANPASVGAEIKRVSTKFLISPKKEAEVRTIQPTRARSLSLDKEKPRNALQTSDEHGKNEEKVKKPYNYSAPTSPIAVTHKRPNMPKTVSPYEHVRKTMIETEEKRNSLSRTSVRNKSTPSPKLYLITSTPSTPISNRDIPKVDDLSGKEKTRQKVEAFYWQKLKELKQKEDEYLLRQSMNNDIRSPSKQNATFHSNSSCSSTNSFVIEPRSYSLPRGRDLNYSMTQQIYALPPFARGAPERRTDSFIRNRTNAAGPDVVFRHLDKSSLKTISAAVNRQMPIFQRGSLTQEARNNMQQPKRVSFEEQFSVKNPSCESGIAKSVALDVKLSNDSYKILSARRAIQLNKKNSDISPGLHGGPPQPPIRTTSVGSVGKNFKIVNNKTIYLGGNPSICSESESGSEAGEIQRILHRSSQNAGHCS
ncbi:unnamed protein product [Parnassius apollo]|uniref:(apollo) hypothetical protein n=1 Tax=Parnassius apollo TaxID=110799 RepID=A0A8S3WW90_PARAO|nr:unnamed protein product [Parnassius apollo]